MFNSLEEEIEFFSTNNNLQANVYTFCDEKIVILDNFWKYPDKIQKLALSIPPTYNPRINNGLQGKRVDCPYYLSHLEPVLSEIIESVFPDYFSTEYIQKCLDVSSFTVNLQTSNLSSGIPHVDSLHPGKLAAGIYLNNDEDCYGGTAFYKYKGQKTVDATSIDYKKYKEYVQESNEDWEKIYLAEAKFNRMIIYKQNILHTAYIPKNTYTEQNPRLMQMIFL